MKLAFRDVMAHVGDASAMTEVTPAHLLDDGYLASRAKLIDPNRAQAAVNAYRDDRDAGPERMAAPIQQSWSAVRKAPSTAHWFGTDEVGPDILEHRTGNWIPELSGYSEL
jgi:gamma-glutamyltranspeptidase